MLKFSFKKIVPLLSLLILTSCSSKPQEVSKTQVLLGTSCKITIYDNMKNREEIIYKCFQRIKQIEDLISVNIDTSEVSNINKNAGVSPGKVSQDTLNVIESGLNYSKESEGSFDISVLPLVKLWGISTEHPKVPSEDEIKNAIESINYKDVEVNKDKMEVFLKKKDMGIDLGGVAKGYVADEVRKVLKENHVKSAIISLGGNIIVMNVKPDGSEWHVGLKSPDDQENPLVGELTLTNKSVVTSGIYERFFEENGVKYHHILNPFTGYPDNNELASVSIISEYSSDGDGMSQVVFHKGLENGMKFAKEKGVEAIFITRDDKIYMTDGASKIFKLTNDRYKVETLSSN